MYIETGATEAHERQVSVLPCMFLFCECVKRRRPRTLLQLAQSIWSTYVHTRRQEIVDIRDVMLWHVQRCKLGHLIVIMSTRKQSTNLQL